MASQGTGGRLSEVFLNCRVGRSDKVYNAWVQRAGDGYLVRFAYGRRGTQLKLGMKTPKLVPLEEATRVVDQLAREKRARGYRDAENATAASRPAKRGARMVKDEKPRPAAAAACAATASRSITDPVFGTLVWDGSYDWSTRSSADAFGGRLPIRVDVANAAEQRKKGSAFSPAPPTAAQRRAWQKFLAGAARYRAVVEDINWRYYSITATCNSTRMTPTHAARCRT